MLKGWLVAVVLSLALAGCGLFSEVWEWNQKLTVEVMTPDGMRSGSAVSHVRWQEANAFDHYPTHYEGEATVVDLGRGRYLFALIGEPTKQIAAYTLHKELGVQRGDYEQLFPRIMRFRGTREVPRDRYPLLVTFDDIADPKTVRKVDPADLEATFGSGVVLTGVTLEINDDEIAYGQAVSVLPWIKRLDGRMLDGRRISTISAENRLANDLSRYNFVRP